MDAGLIWGVKSSLIAYVRGPADGAVEVISPALEHGEASWWFPASHADADGVQFGGALRLTGHWGMLDVRIGRPAVRREGEKLMLLVDEVGGRGGSLPLAELTHADTGEFGTIFTAALTGAGAILLGGQYAAGTPLEPVTIVGGHA